MLKTDKAYAAGLLDGEGSISMVRVGGRNRKAGNPYWRVVVAISNCDIEVIHWLNKKWPGNCVWGRDRGATRRPQHTWRLYGRNATKFLKHVQSYCIIKENRVIWALEVNAIQSRPPRPFQPYPLKKTASRLATLRGLFDQDRTRSFAARGRAWNGI